MNIFNNPIFEIIISMVLIFALLSILVSIINEWFSHVFDRRSKMLKDAIVKLIDDPHNLSYGYLLFNHFSIQSIHKVKPGKEYLFGIKTSPKKSGPQYLSSSMFADALIDVIASQANHKLAIRLDETPGVKKFILVKPVTTTTTETNTDEATGNEAALPLDSLMDRFQVGLAGMSNSPLKDMLISVKDKAISGSDSKLDVEKLKASIEAWYNDYMDRVTGWYKGSQRSKLLIVGFLVAIMLNVDSLHLIRVLTIDQNLRNKLVEKAEIVSDNYMQLTDSAKSNTSELINTFMLDDTIAKNVADSLMPDNKSVLSDKPQLLTDVLMEKDSTKYREWANKILKNDSISKMYSMRADSVLGILSAYEIPVGYNRNTAPFSWFGKKSSLKNSSESAKLTRIQIYNSHRNKGSGFVYIKYILGIIISGFSLSFGAPFWFDMLNKLINLRRSGVKPETAAETKSNK